MTYIELISAGVSLGGGDESLHPLVKTVMNGWIQQHSKVFPWLLSFTTDPKADLPLHSLTKDTQYVSLPSDYFHMESIVLTDANGNTVIPPIPFMSQRDWDNTSRNPIVTGTPTFAFIDHENSRLYFWPIPGADYTYYIRYKKLPDEMDTVGSSDDAKTANELNLGFPDAYTLIRVAKAVTLEFREKTQESIAEWAHVEKALQLSKLGNYDRSRPYRRMRLARGAFSRHPYPTN